MSRDIFLDISVRNVRRNFLRSVLASIGIVIGVVAISAMGMLGTNMELMVKQQLTASVNTVVITADTMRGGFGGPPGMGGGGSSDDGLSEIQVKEIRQAAAPYTVIPLRQKSDKIKIGSQEGRATIYGVDPDDVSSFLEMQGGTFLKGGDDAIVGATLADRFSIKVGNRIKIGNTSIGAPPPITVRVAGIIKERGLSVDINTDNAILVVDSFFKESFKDANLYDQVNVIVSNTDDLDEVIEKIDKKLNRNKDVVSIRDSRTRLQSLSSTLSTITNFIMAIGSISLVVAAVSIFNVMMMSVNERVQEVGILRSIGTEKREVRRMFLYEASILGLLGGCIGGLLSLFIGYSVVSAMIGNTTYFFMPQSIMYVPIGILIGFLICVGSGLYPAWRASNLDPIEALRSE